MDVKPNRKKARVKACVRAQLCKKGGGPGLPVPNSPYGLCGRKATLKKKKKKQKKKKKKKKKKLVYTQPHSKPCPSACDTLAGGC